MIGIGTEQGTTTVDIQLPRNNCLIHSGPWAGCFMRSARVRHYCKLCPTVITHGDTFVTRGREHICLPCAKRILESWSQDAPERQMEYAQEKLAIQVTEELRRVMTDIGMPGRRLAQLLDCHRSNVTMLLSGNRNLTLHKLAHLANALGCDVQVRLVKRDSPAVVSE